MRRRLLVIAAVLSATILQAAPSVDLTAASGVELYSTKVGGTPVEGVLERVEITLPQYKSAVLFASPMGFDAINQLQPWYTTDISTIFTKVHNLVDVRAIKYPKNNIFFAAFELEEGGYMVIQPISALDVTSWIEVKDKCSVDMVCGTLGTGSVEEGEAPIFAYATGDDLYQAMADMWGDILEAEQVKDRTTWRDSKEFPEVFRYLGWCSWEQYRKDIYESLLVDAVDDIERSEIPIRWVLIDDGHQTRAEDGGALINFEISESKFPNGWAPILAKRSDKVKWFGLWHSMYGEWSGVSVDHTMEDLNGHLIPHRANSLITAQTQEASDLFFDKLVGSVSQPGFDFTKVDVQTRDFNNYVGKDNPVIAHRQNAEALEAETHGELNGLINCMAQNLPCIFNTRYSAVTRVSVDYKVNNTPLSISHIYQSYHNTLWMGQTIWPDHDMFHSSDAKWGRLMAVSKAMSGAPIYLSDAPKDMLAEFINPIVYSDGEVLRPLAPGAPLPESFFADALMGSEVYKVIAPMSKSSAAVVVYNISSNYVDDMKCSVSAKDYTFADGLVQPYPGLRELSKEGLVYYDWYEKRGGVLSGDYEFTLGSVEDKLLLLSEIENGWSVIGLEEKYLSGVAVKEFKSSKKSIKITMHEAGAIVVYSDKVIKRSSSGEVEALGNGIYRVVGAESEVTLYR
ncbi:MAG: Sip1-related alpha-galactosidase [Rikenellaceae bacterium]